ncbi:MAG: hypothetical protein J0I34_19020 [Pseudonocardia sp.]|uniref:hypothetical protein n=1 Tax=unclassified Pseudonocardia TaxID=2619320 RepID=UPI00086D3C21|nr:MULTISPECIES: hypothetical protein [unclassified Pseudonocardia]MBN9110859.1 hypothetical protein [Pseudonocardia sp.]ODU26843.1 MAG: hypothetical protein ABS80_05665 [Pseudonocardia sp. SCN 72-51]ODV05435.1 MAG: hypothetical protein ABT15_17305 [Pseudonocardia sp. SCN 73-27]
MAGKIVIAAADGSEVDGREDWESGRQPGDHRFARFSLTFADGGALHLVDPRRLGRIRFDPPVADLGPGAATVDEAELLPAIPTCRSADDRRVRRR